MPTYPLIDYLGIVFTANAAPATDDLLRRSPAGGFETFSIPLTTPTGQVLMIDPVTGRVSWQPLNKRVAVADVNYTLVAGDGLVAYTTLTSARVVTLPAASSFPVAKMIWIKDESGGASGSNTLTATPASGTIDGVSSKTIVSAAYGHGFIYSNGTSWFTA